MPQELADTIAYLEKNFTQKELFNLATKIEHITKLISENPRLFRNSEFDGTYQVVVLKFITMYYRFVGNEVEILSFFSNRQDPHRRKFE